MKKVLTIAAVLSLSGLAFAQRIRVVEDDPPEAVYARGKSIQATILLREPGRQSSREAQLDDVFFDGQRFRLRVAAPQDGYLYVICENSQGTAVVLYPNDNGPNGPSNRVRESRHLTIPSRNWFQFDNEPGTERLYLVLAEDPIAELDRVARRGGEIPLDLLGRYTRLGDGQTKGIIRADDGDFLVRRIELRHESR
jgi:hypothetical protein